MKTREDLRPTQKPLVIDILKSLDMDVSKWADMKGGAARAASNPKYCYNWSFRQPGEFFVVCLWYNGLKQKGSQLFFEVNRAGKRAHRTEPGSSTWNKRSDDFDQSLWLAYSHQLPLRVIVVEGDGGSVRARLLDDAFWAVTEYDIATSKCTIVRGAEPVPVSINADDIELAGFEGQERKRFVQHRRREDSMRRHKIEDALARTGKLVCEVPKCGFDFEKRYGAVGKGYAQVHHLVPLHKAPKTGRKVTLNDLAIVCANCHAMIHAYGECRPLKGLIS
ncbi:5-methylcytosine-specific restriction protein A [Bradyrhizobium sp. USDA 4473]